MTKRMLDDQMYDDDDEDFDIDDKTKQRYGYGAASYEAKAKQKDFSLVWVLYSAATTEIATIHDEVDDKHSSFNQF